MKKIWMGLAAVVLVMILGVTGAWRQAVMVRAFAILTPTATASATITAPAAVRASWTPMATASVITTVPVAARDSWTPMATASATTTARAWEATMAVATEAAGTDNRK